MRELVLAVVVVDDDRAQPRALDDGRMVAVERDADRDGARPVEELARERYGERELLVDLGRVRFGVQLGFVFVSWPRIAPAPNAALWRLT